MGIIRKLPEHVINQIKAGEVVDRPSSVVKELLENALDAGADEISLELLDGGRQLIRVTDNGKGMDKEDLVACLERHATSKLQKLDDLETISSLGFRGEAIPSIASVSRFSIRSRRRGASLGYEIDSFDGRAEPPCETSMPEGTSVTVRDLFVNVPARQKFLKSTATEFSHIHDLVFAAALAYPEISWRFSHNGRDVFGYRKQAGVAARFEEVMGGEAPDFVSVDFSRGSFRISGFAGLPATGRPLPKYFITFVNGRMVRDRVVRAGVLQAYNGLLMKGLLPSAVVFLEVDPTWLDVNVHPAKTELRFHDAASVQELVAIGIQDAVKGALAQSDSLHSTQAAAARPASWASLPETPATAEVSPAEEIPSRPRPLFTAYGGRPAVSPSASPASPSSRPAPSSWSARPSTPSPMPERASPAPKLFEAEPSPAPEIFTAAQGPLAGAQFLGQYLNCYLLMQCGNELWVVDQHAFHERILFEEMVAAARAGKPVGRNELLTPLLVPVPRGTAGVVADFGERLERLGFRVEALAGDTVAVHAVPATLDPTRAGEMFDEILARVFALSGVASSDVHPLLLRAARLSDEMAAVHASSLNDDAVYHLLYATMACHSAVRAGEALAPEQVRRLLARAADVDFFSNCPHGRPVVRKFTEADVGLWFARL